MAIALCSVAFTSCSDDDESGYTPNGPTATYAGKLPVKVGNYNFQYDDNGRCTNVTSSNGDEISIDYAKGKIYLDEMGDNMDVSFNKSGYITKISGSYDYSDYDESDKGSGNVTFKYNGDGNLTSMSISSKGTYTYDGESFPYSNSINATCKWSGGDLVSINYKYSESEDGEKYESTDVFTIDYDKTLDNETRMFTMLWYNIFDNESFILAPVGLLGKGTAHLPEMFSYVYYDGSDDDYEESHSVSYSLNPDGTIDWEDTYYETYNYRYMSFSSDDADVPSTYTAKAMPQAKKKLTIRDFFRPKHSRK